MLKIGIMGGTFNPVHNAHTELAKKALEQFGLDKILFITNGNPPHKKNSSILDASIRHKMVTIAIKDYPQFEACDYEVMKKTPSYTYETLRYLKNKLKPCELYFIVGADSFHDITSWVKPRLIMELCTLLIYRRDGYDPEGDFEKIKKDYYLNVEYINADPVNISSTMIRRMYRDGKDPSELLPPGVGEFIRRNKIYPKWAKDMERQLKRNLSDERFVHSVNVSKTAFALALRHGLNTEKARIAGLLHDCAKCIPYERMLKMCDDLDVELDETEKKIPALIHAKLGERLAMAQFLIRDGEILEAIKCHTLGDPEMGDIAKAVYVADLIEPSRSFDGIEELRSAAQEELDLAVLKCTQATIRFNTEHNRPIHEKAYEVMEAFSKKTAKKTAEENAEKVSSNTAAEKNEKNEG